ncbi:hypothetical protein PLESTB_000602600 [Pleodorina starrii]|uniref:inosine/xanthosine triphosphatase n=1 Tax=Pleodorina starrii TaxID=330485 RepID=A0A9W6BHT2_9CHLO|nr:hypothetical protein PLESTM_002032300 [Pleodorina starrii]GLC52263.1 hypothetical protein PLESTB_000602600 [Pleodorina starrii]GLC67555.1 hypothetical protein PLESTF_000573000 [Pleodorina starrii]
MAISSRALQVRAQAGIPSPGGSPHHPQHTTTNSGPRVVLVASKNPVKVNAVQRALQRCFPSLEVTVQGRQAPSGVPDQPRGDQETLAGARNRVAALRSAPAPYAAPTTTSTSAACPASSTAPCCPESSSPSSRAAEAASTSAVAGTAAAAEEGASGGSDLLVAIEGGVGSAEAPGQAGALECFAWVCVRDPHTGAESTARSASFALPPPLSDLILRQGLELGDADDAVFGRVRSKQGSGTIGQLSNGVLDRTDYYVQAAVCALLPYMQPQLYGAEYGRFLGHGEPCVDSPRGTGDNMCM